MQERAFPSGVLGPPSLPLRALAALLASEAVGLPALRPVLEVVDIGDALSR